MSMDQLGNLLPDRRRAAEFCLTVFDVAPPARDDDRVIRHDGAGPEIFLMRVVGGTWTLISRVRWKLMGSKTDAEEEAKKIAKEKGVRFVRDAWHGSEAKLGKRERDAIRRAEEEEERERQAALRQEEANQAKLRRSRGADYDNEDLDGVKAPKRKVRHTKGRRFRAPPDGLPEGEGAAEEG